MHERDFDALVRRHAGAVGAYARALARNRWDAEEAVQETFLRAWRYRSTFDRRGSFEGWLLRICRNCLIDLADRRPAGELLVGDLEPLGSDRAHPDDGASTALTELLDLIGHLPPAQREVLVLCGLLGYDYEGAAEVLEVPVGTIRSRLHRARSALAAHRGDVRLTGA